MLLAHSGTVVSSAAAKMNALTVITAVLLVAGSYATSHLQAVSPYSFIGAPTAVSYAGVPQFINVGPFTPAPVTFRTASTIPVQTVSPQTISYRTVQAAPAVVTQPQPVVTVAAHQPVASVSIPDDVVKVQYHTQDEFGGYSFGHSGGPSSRAEVRDHLGTVKGAINYVDPTGKVQSQQYIADALGFRVAASDLPLAPPPAPVPVVVGPAPVVDTPEVAQAKAAFRKAYDEAAAAAAAAPDTSGSRRKRDTVTAYHVPNVFPQLHSFPLATTFPSLVTAGTGAPTFYTAAAPAAPSFYTAAAPAAVAVTGQAPASTFAYRNAELLRVVNNPGHAFSYRVY